MLLVSLRVAGAWLKPPLVVVRVPRGYSAMQVDRAVSCS